MNNLFELNYSQILEKYNLDEDSYSKEDYKSDIKELFSCEDMATTLLDVIKTHD